MPSHPLRSAYGRCFVWHRALLRPRSHFFVSVVHLLYEGKTHLTEAIVAFGIFTISHSSHRHIPPLLPPTSTDHEDTYDQTAHATPNRFYTAHMRSSFMRQAAR